MQVDYAKLKYMLPRLVGLRSNLSRQGGTGGTMANRGSGEKKIELDRRVIEKRMTLLRRELDSISKIRDTQTKKRIRSGLDDGHVRVALLIPWKDSGAESRLRAAATVLSSEYTDDGILITALLDRSRVGEYQRFILP